MIELFLDGFGTYVSGGEQTGLYMRLANVIDKRKNDPSLIAPLCFFPRIVDQHEAMKFVAEELVTLKEGINIRDCLTNSDFKIKGILFQVIADLPQASKNSNHGGTACNLNCRNCWTPKEDRVKWNENIIDHVYTRRKEQTKVIFELTKSLETKKSKTEARSATGVSLKKGPFYDIDFDTHSLQFQEPMHLIDLGIIGSIICAMSKNMSPDQQQQCQNKIEKFCYPSNWIKIPGDLLSRLKKKANPKLSQSITRIKTLAFILLLQRGSMRASAQKE